MKPFDPKKPCRTRNGRAARIICTDGKGDQPIIALIDYEDTDIVTRFTTDGHWQIQNGECGNDLINIPEKHEMWVNVYTKQDTCYTIGDGCFTKEQADKEASGVPFRIACVKVTFEGGEGL